MARFHRRCEFPSPPLLILSQTNLPFVHIGISPHIYIHINIHPSPRPARGCEVFCRLVVQLCCAAAMSDSSRHPTSIFFSLVVFTSFHSHPLSQSPYSALLHQNSHSLSLNPSLSTSLNGLGRLSQHVYAGRLFQYRRNMQYHTSVDEGWIPSGPNSSARRPLATKGHLVLDEKPKQSSTQDILPRIERRS